MGGTFGVYPRTLANEIGAVTEILRSSQWNMAYGAGLAHERLESEFAEAVEELGLRAIRFTTPILVRAIMFLATVPRHSKPS